MTIIMSLAGIDEKILETPEQAFIRKGGWSKNG